jgi:hypothetical protein
LLRRFTPRNDNVGVTYAPTIVGIRYNCVDDSRSPVAGYHAHQGIHRVTYDIRNGLMMRRDGVAAPGKAVSSASTSARDLAIV